MMLFEEPSAKLVIPAQAGIRRRENLGSRLRGNDRSELDIAQPIIDRAV